MSFSIIEKNLELKRLYGNRVDCDKPNFRLVEARGLVERKYGTYRIETRAGIFLRNETGWMDTLKYPYDQDFIVLERLFPNFQPEELLGERFSYEPIWVFKYDNGKRTPNSAINKMTDMIIYRLLNRSKEDNKTQKDLEIEEGVRKAKESQRISDSIDTTSLESALHDGDAIFMDSTKRFGENNAGNDNRIIITERT